MSTRDLERELATVLHRHAEDAMNRTDTQAELRKFHDRAAEEGPGRNRARWAVGGAAAAAVVAVGVGLLAADLGDDRADSGPAGDPAPAQTAAEQVAQDAVTAFTTGDADRLASLLAPGALPGWRAAIREDQAWSRTYDVEPCREQGSRSEGTEVGCLFSYHLWHSEELGVGPFENNFFTVVVKDGKVVSAVASYNFANNGQSDLFDAIGAWVRANHPGDWRFMANTEGHTPAEMQSWYQLWEQYSQEYADAQAQAGEGDSAP